MKIIKNSRNRYEATQNSGTGLTRVEYIAWGDTFMEAFNRLMAKLGYLPEVDTPHPLQGVSEQDLINNLK